MAILIGGSGSTGSSLLRRILNRNSRLICGPETSLFCKKELFKNWNKSKHRILKRGFQGLRNRGWHLYNGVDLLKEENAWNSKELQGVIRKSQSFQEFADVYFLKHQSLKSEMVWLEKTPANSYTFKDFLNGFEKSKVIHIYRNPYETILSLHNRGFSIYYSVALYLLNNAHALNVESSENYFAVSYENLTENPLQTIESISKFIGVNFESAMLENKDQTFSDDPVRIGQWTHSETGPISPQSSKFDQLTTEQQDYIIAVMNAIQIDEQYAIKHHLNHTTIDDLRDAFGYSQKEIVNSRKRYNLPKEKLKDQWLRFRRNYPNALLNYPIKLKR